MKYLIVLLLFLTGCTINQPNVIHKDWVCLKTQTDLSPGINFNGDFTMVATESCVVSRCARYVYLDSKRWYVPNDKNVIEIVNDNECL